MLSRTLAPALHLLRWTSCSATLSHGICCLALSVFMVCDCSEDRGQPAGRSSAWLQCQHLPCMESCVPQCSKCVSLSISSFAPADRRPSTAGPRIRSALEYTCSNQLNHSFTQQICIGYLLCTGTGLEHGHTAINETAETPVLMELMFKWREVGSKQSKWVKYNRVC